MAAYYILKSEPKTYSIDQLKKDRSTNWNNIRNYQARNFLREMQVGDQALIYHSNDDKAVVGLAQVIKAAYPDYDADSANDSNGDWSQVDIKYVAHAKNPVALATFKTHPVLKHTLLVKQSRLSVIPLSKEEFQIVCKLAGFA